MHLPRNDQTDALVRAILSLQTKDECYDFFEDLCTIKELLAMSQRLRVAQLLSDGESYQFVTEQTGASSATVGRVKRSLDYGSGGYQSVLKKLREEK